MYVLYSHPIYQSMDQPGKVANPDRGQLNRENEYSPVPVRTCLRIWSRETGSTVPSRVSLLISIHRRNMVLTGFLPSSAAASIYLIKPPYAIESVPSLSARTDGVHCRESAGTWPVNLKVVPNKCCLGRSLYGPINMRLSFPHPLLLLV